VSSETFEAFYQREYDSVVGLAYALSGSRWAAEDLAQDAFVVIHRRWQTVSGYDRPDAFVRRVTANLAVSRARRLAAEARAVARLATGRRPPAAQIDAASSAFWAAVRRLPRRQAQVLALFYLEDRTAADIASILGCSPDTVRVHLHRGRGALARSLRLKGDPYDL
jgi:RNA polymerase sigma factor (sigma-70 family)